MEEPAAKYIAVAEIERLLKEDQGVTLIDARTDEEYAEAHVPGAVNIPIDALPGYAEGRGEGTAGIIATMCGSTGRGEKAAAILASHGVANVQVMEGGLKAWKEAGLSVA